MTETAPFSGFSEHALTFLRDLRANNNRGWFNDHKTTYEHEIKRPAEAFSAAMSVALEHLTSTPHRHKVFRIYRDVRFSKDKTPYNAHLHIAFKPAHAKAAPPGWFFGLDPEKLTLGTGIFAFDKADLETFRQRVLGPDGAELGGIIKALQSERIRLGRPDLKRVPSGYPRDHPQAELLRYKGLSAWIDHSNPSIVADPTIIDVCTAAFRRLKPVFDWLIA